MVSFPIIANSAFTCGLVNQALASAVRSLLKEHLILAAQLEHQLTSGNLTMQKLWFYVQPCLTGMLAMSDICADLMQGSCRGGATLSLLHERTMGMIGNPKGEDLCLYLVQAVSTVVSSW